MNMNDSVCYRTSWIQTATEFYFDRKEMNFVGGMMHGAMLASGIADGVTKKSFRFRSSRRECVVVFTASAEEDSILIHEVQEEPARRESSVMRASGAATSFFWIIRIMQIFREEISGNLLAFPDNFLARFHAFLRWLAHWR